MSPLLSSPFCPPRALVVCVVILWGACLTLWHLRFGLVLGAGANKEDRHVILSTSQNLLCIMSKDSYTPSLVSLLLPRSSQQIACSTMKATLTLEKPSGSRAVYTTAEYSRVSWPCICATVRQHQTSSSHFKFCFFPLWLHLVPVKINTWTAAKKKQNQSCFSTGRLVTVLDESRNSEDGPWQAVDESQGLTPIS